MREDEEQTSECLRTSLIKKKTRKAYGKTSKRLNLESQTTDIIPNDHYYFHAIDYNGQELLVAGEEELPGLKPGN